jgi:N-acetylneuraminic acid mutarotase
MFLFFFVGCLFVAVFNPVLAVDLVENSWNTKASMNQARAGLGAVALDGKIYAIGGYTTCTDVPSDFVGTNERYDPATDAWTILEPMPTPRGRFAIVAYEGKIYCIGGYTQEDGYVGLGTNEVYDIVTDSWSTKAAIPFAGSVVGQVVNGKIFVIPVARNDLYMYDPITDTWTTKTRIPLQDVGYTLSVVNNRLIVIFDHSPSGQSESPLIKVVMIYDIETDTWSEKMGSDTFFGSDFAVAGATTGLYAPQKIYLIGGASTIVYDPKSDTWTTTKAIPTKRADFAVTVLDDTLYVIGGERTYLNILFFLNPVRFKAFSITEQYIPLDYSGAVSASPESFLNGAIRATIFLTACIVILLGLFLYFRPRKNLNKIRQTTAYSDTEINVRYIQCLPVSFFSLFAQSDFKMKKYKK